LCGIEASLFAKLIWKGASAATLRSVGEKAMFWADSSTTPVAAEALGWALGAGSAEPELAGEPVGLGAAEADGTADAEGAAEAEGATDPEGAAEALAPADGTGVADGAGAYVQPSVEVAHAATARIVRPAASRRMVRMGGQDLEMFAGDRDRDVWQESTASGPHRRIGPGATRSTSTPAHRCGGTKVRIAPGPSHEIASGSHIGGCHGGPAWHSPEPMVICLTRSSIGSGASASRSLRSSPSP
jgi:hypothetical protein